MKLLGRLGVVGLVCGVGLVAGCSGAEPQAAEPTSAVVEPSEPVAGVEPSPQASAEGSEEQDVAAAKDLVADFYATFWALANDGFDHPGSMGRFWGNPDIAHERSSLIQSLVDSGRRTEGVGEIVSQTVTEYDGAGQSAQVRLEVCVDYSAIRNFDASGNLMENTVPRMRSKFLVVEQPNGWTINELEQDVSWVC